MADHATDALGVAERLWDTWVSPGIRRVLSHELGGQDEARAWFTFLAGVHDVGKITPVFAVQASGPWRDLGNDLRIHGLAIPETIPADRRARLRHELAGHIELGSHLEGAGWPHAAAESVAVVVGGHHGLPPTLQQLRVGRALRSEPEMFGSDAWGQGRRQLLEWALDRSGVRELLSSGLSHPLTPQVQMLLTGLVVVTDWIASNQEFFPLRRLGHFGPLDVDVRVEQGWASLSLPRPWCPSPRPQDRDEIYRARFGWGPDMDPRPVQVTAVEAAQSIGVPGLLVFEAPMGEGKTEGALIAAEILAARGGAGGCFVALPTQATAGAMFARVLDWLSRLPDDADLADDAHRHSVGLLHGKAALDPQFRDLWWRAADSVGSVAPDADGGGSLSVQAYAHRWMTRKKSLLADFGVGTVDQLLLMALQSRHVCLRHLGLARKVVIVDEVHSYSAYMDVYLRRALEWLAATGTSVVLLSATLPPSQREQLHDAYRRGLAAREVTERKRIPRRERRARPEAAAEHPTSGVVAPTDAYPLVTTTDATGSRTWAAAASSRTATINVRPIDDDTDTLDETLRASIGDEGCAVVVCNTVSRALQAAADLRDRGWPDVRLTHARFAAPHRMEKDRSLVAAFGARASVGAGRPTGPTIVVGTQVLEQSLDVDFDVMVTDLAPVDLLLQRMGRLHRHPRERPAAVSTPQCLVRGVDDWTAVPARAVRGSRAVYSEAALLRSAALVLARADEPWSLPEDIAPLVRLAYDASLADVVPTTWIPDAEEAHRRLDRHLEDRRARAQTFLLRDPHPQESLIDSLSAAGNGADDEGGPRGFAQVRDGEDSIEVILVRPGEGGGWRLLEDDDGAVGAEVSPDEAPPLRLARALAACTVRLPAACTRPDKAREVIEALERRYYPPGWQEDRLLAGSLVLPVAHDYPDSSDDAAVIAGFRFRYRLDSGLEHEHAS